MTAHLAPIVVAALALPQEPPSDFLQEALKTHGLQPRVEAILKASRPRRLKYRKIKPPQLVVRIREAGAMAYELDLRRHLSGAYEATPRSDFWFDFADQQLLGKVARKIKQPRIASVKDIKKFFDYVERDMRKALEIGRPLERTVPRMHALMERIQDDREGYIVSEDDHKLIDDEVHLATKVDMPAMWMAAKKVILLARTLSEEKLLAKLQAAERQRVIRVGKVVGDVMLDVITPYGRMVVGGPDRNEYDCTVFDVIVDLGGDDLYRGPAGGAGELRRFAVCIDLGGNDTYECMNDALGSASYGIGVLVDVEGDDKYKATARSAGFGAAGVGVFLDVAGNDELDVGAHSCGVGLAGVGIFADLGGSDVQQASDVSFGCGLPAGFGLFLDAAGDDKRTQSQGSEETKYPYLGLGAARGLQGVMAGGVGVCLDLAGNDSYGGGDLCCGAGEEGGVGIFVDALGDDVYAVHDLSIGAARRGGIAVFQDWAGKDTYQAAAMAIGYAVLGSRAFCFDEGGDDIYQVRSTGLGMVGGDAMAFFWDTKGRDSYLWDRGGKEPVDSRLGLGVFLDTGGGKDSHKRAGPAFFGDAEGDGRTLFRGARSDLQGTLHVFIDSK